MESEMMETDAMEMELMGMELMDMEVEEEAVAVAVAGRGKKRAAEMEDLWEHNRAVDKMVKGNMMADGIAADDPEAAEQIRSTTMTLARISAAFAMTKKRHEALNAFVAAASATARASRH